MPRRKTIYVTGNPLKKKLTPFQRQLVKQGMEAEKMMDEIDKPVTTKPLPKELSYYSNQEASKRNAKREAREAEKKYAERQKALTKLVPLIKNVARDLGIDPADILKLKDLKKSQAEQRKQAKEAEALAEKTKAPSYFRLPSGTRIETEDFSTAVTLMTKYRGKGTPSDQRGALAQKVADTVFNSIFDNDTTVKVHHGPGLSSTYHKRPHANGTPNIIGDVEIDFASLGVQRIARERDEHLTKHGFDVTRDKEYEEGELTSAALYCLTLDPGYWPAKWREADRLKIFRKQWYDRLVVAGSLLAAEFDRHIAMRQQNFEARHITGDSIKVSDELIAVSKTSHWAE